jgi:hypothetical protein
VSEYIVRISVDLDFLVLFIDGIGSCEEFGTLGGGGLPQPANIRRIDTLTPINIEAIFIFFIFFAILTFFISLAFFIIRIIGWKYTFLAAI